MNKRKVIAQIGESNWDKFCKFMEGQTVGMKNGEVDYYECDVENFINKMSKRTTFFD